MSAILHFGKKEKQINRVLLIPAEAISPNPAQPRRSFSEAELQSLADSIRENGLLQPVTVRRAGEGYHIISGERRFRACQIAGMTEIPCIAAEIGAEDSAVLALVENIQRQDLNFFEEAAGMASLMELRNFTQEQLARRLSLSQSAIANKLRLLRLSADEQRAILAAGLTERHARALIRLSSPKEREKALRLIIDRNLNVGKTEQLIDEMLSDEDKGKTRRGRIAVVKDVRLFANSIRRAVEVMKSTGIPAEAAVEESDEFLLYTVRIPKRAAVRSPAKASR